MKILNDLPPTTKSSSKIAKLTQESKIYFHSSQVLFVALLAYISHGAPLEGFGDATDAEIEEIRAGTYLEMFDENPTYNYNYKVADDVEQTYLSLEEARNDGVVTGMYSYVDPLVSKCKLCN